MKDPVCAICGKTNGVKVHTLPHGSISLCCSNNCCDMFCAITQESVPILWVGKEDFLNNELLTPEELKGNDRALIEAARKVADHICTDGFWDEYSDGLYEGVNEFELQIIRDTPKDQLPLLIGQLKHGNDDYLAERIKGG